MIIEETSLHYIVFVNLRDNAAVWFGPYLTRESAEMVIGAVNPGWRVDILAIPATVVARKFGDTP